MPCDSSASCRKKRSGHCCVARGRWCFRVPKKGGGSPTSKRPRAVRRRWRRTVRDCVNRYTMESRGISFHMETGGRSRIAWWRWRRIMTWSSGWDARRAVLRKGSRGTRRRMRPASIYSGRLPDETGRIEVMRVTITARHTELDEDLRAHARELVEKVAKLAGYTARFIGADRIYILGETEITYLAALDDKGRRKAIDTFLSHELPCIIITKGQEPPGELVQLARDRGIPVIRTKLKTAEFYRRLKPFLDDAFAPRTTVHGSLADVFGVGLLFRGRSGIGKSECVLDLVERGHRLVADDVVH